MVKKLSLLLLVAAVSSGVCAADVDFSWDTVDTIVGGRAKLSPEEFHDLPCRVHMSSSSREEKIAAKENSFLKALKHMEKFEYEQAEYYFLQAHKLGVPGAAGKLFECALFCDNNQQAFSYLGEALEDIFAPDPVGAQELYIFYERDYLPVFEGVRVVCLRHAAQKGHEKAREVLADQCGEHWVDVCEGVNILEPQHAGKANIQYLVCWLAAEYIGDNGKVNGLSKADLMSGLCTYEDNDHSVLYGDIQGHRYATLDHRFQIAFSLLQRQDAVAWIDGKRAYQGGYASAYQAMVGALDLCTIDGE